MRRSSRPDESKRRALRLFLFGIIREDCLILIDGSRHGVQRRQTREACGLAMCRAGKHLRIAVAEETAHVIADDVEPLDWGSVRTDCLQVGVDIDTHNAAEDPAAQGDAIERAVLYRGKTNGHLSFHLIIFLYPTRNYVYYTQRNE